MIDREDMLELTRRMTLKRNCFTRIAGAYMDGDGEIDDTFNVHFLNLSGSDKTKNMAVAKEIPFARTNVQLKEHAFAPEAMGAGSMWQLLSGIHSCGLQNDLLMEVLYSQIGAVYRPGKDYAIDVFHGTYDVRRKSSDGADLGESEEVFDFIICTVSPLYADYEIGKPDFGFLFPAFSGRSTWTGGIDIYNRDPDHPAVELERMLLGK